MPYLQGQGTNHWGISSICDFIAQRNHSYFYIIFFTNILKYHFHSILLQIYVVRLIVRFNLMH